MQVFGEKTIPSDEHPEGTHIRNMIENPCARIFCRSRRLRPTTCDGTCLNCRKEREDYIQSTAQIRMDRINAHPSTGESLDHDAEIVTYDQVLALVRAEVWEIDQRKIIPVERAEQLLSQIAQDVGEITLNPPPHPHPGEHH